MTLQPIRRFGFDAAILFSDILMLPWALGHGLEYREGEGPVLPPLRDEAGLAALDPAGCRMRSRRSWKPCGWSAQGFGRGLSRTALIGFAGAPFTVACYMIEGGGSKDFAATRAMAYREPALFERLIALLTDATVDVSGGADRGRRRSGDAVRQLGRRAVAIAVPAACDPADARRSSPALRSRFPDCAGDRLPAPGGADGRRLRGGDRG